MSLTFWFWTIFVLGFIAIVWEWLKESRENQSHWREWERFYRYDDTRTTWNHSHGRK